MRKYKGLFLPVCIVFFLILPGSLFAQFGQKFIWLNSGKAWVSLEGEGNELVKYSLPKQQREVLVSQDMLIPVGAEKPISIRRYSFSADESKVLINNNTQKVWRYDTRGDYWVLDLQSKKLRQLGKNLPESSLMFAKFSPDGTKVAFVSQHNIYVEELSTGEISQLTYDGSQQLINGTFDWAYEEEFGCRDGFRWSPDGHNIAYWQVDASKVHDFLMINNTDSIYSFVIPVEYPKVGQAPSPVKIGVVSLDDGITQWMEIPGDPQQHYLPRMEWAEENQLIVQQLNRKQNQSSLMLCDATTGLVNTIYSETDEAWIDIKARWDGGDPSGWQWLDGKSAFLWISEKDGWRHIYKVSKDGNKEKLLTKGGYDMIDLVRVDEQSGYVYFTASPNNATRKYLYRVKLSGAGKLELISPADEKGSHSYRISPNGKYAMHRFSSANTRPMREWVALPGHKALNPDKSISTKLKSVQAAANPVVFFQVTTVDGVNMDGWMVKPENFDPAKKYPLVFYVYGEPAGQTVTDRWGTGKNRLYNGDMAKDGYIYISVENRGTPAPKGREWRKSIYRKIGRLNIRDQAMALTEILKWDYVDSSRVAVWGWSGGGSSTLNLLFQYPSLYQTGIAIAAVANQLTYDNIYQERYMGLPQENKENFVAGSPITYAKNLEGNLLYIHGTGDDNVHYQNAEMLLNELIKYNKQFRFMAYPNRSHSISEGEGTFKHLSTLYTQYLKKHCPPGAR